MGPPPQRAELPTYQACLWTNSIIFSVACSADGPWWRKEVAGKIKTAQPVAACPWCGAPGRTAWGTCETCGRYYFARGWARAPRSRLRLWWIAAALGVLAVLAAWMSSPFLPDPITILFRRPTTQLSSTAPANQWAMWGLDLQQRRYVADAFHPAEGRRVWSIELGTPTRSVPVIVDNVIYIGGHFQLLALDADTGHRLWDIATTGPVHTSPAVAGNKLYIGLQDWRMLALDRSTGRTLWEFMMQSPVSGSASVATGIVYIGSMDGFVYALDASTGTLIWKYKTQEQALSPPALEAGTLFVSTTEGSLYALNARTGQSWLRFRTPDRLQDSPVVANGLVYFPSGGQIYAVAADAYEIPGQYQLQLVWAQFWLWQFPVPKPPGQPGGRWRFFPRQPTRGIISAPAVAPEAFYVGDTNGYFYARDALKGEELWQFKAGGAIMASPVIVGPRVYFAAIDGCLYALDRSTGELLWKLAFGEPIQAAPVFANGRLYVRTRDGWLHAIE
jgi:outer membrane protein assembly factor BamB